MLICVLLVALLGSCDTPFQLCVSVVQVRYEALCFWGGYLFIWLCHEAWVVTFVGEEWRNSSHFIRGIVVGEFCQGEQGRPVILLIVRIGLEILLQDLVQAFCLS